ncbi:MAG: HAD-IIIC family phosphatase [Anaerolineae bacterium]|nr:HAD-IIIC family phosphatase [Gemmatimonadaceae bacterium]
MNFLDAHKIVAGFKGGAPLRFLLATSGTPDKLDLFLRAAAANRGFLAHVRTLPFGTLGQTLRIAPVADEIEVFCLFPWDFIPEADWRSGVPSTSADEEALRSHALATAEHIAHRRLARVLYVAAPIPPLLTNPTDGANLERWLGSVIQSIGARLLPAETFSLASYLANGSPFAGTLLGQLAEAVIDRAISAPPEPKKVLVTDLDNVMWSGVIGEDGVEGIHFTPEGVGYRFFLYQTLLAKLQREGAILAAVSRNDEDLALAPFRAGGMTLVENDFVSIVASYNAKSAQIAEIASRLNLGLDAFVFVDDNPIELAEVSSSLPTVRCVQFPPNDEGIPRLFAELSELFARATVTGEDRERTAMYRRRLEGMAPSEAQGADLTTFLQDLGMTLTLHDRTTGDRARAVQLINKTNQFNLNGRRVSDEEVGAVLASGGRLYGASLADRSGSHGEILACLIDEDRVVRSLVMSCRVFQRRVEHAFFAWLATQNSPPAALDFAETERNEPMRQFFRDAAFQENGLISFDPARFAEDHRDDMSLFAVHEERSNQESGTRD